MDIVRFFRGDVEEPWEFLDLPSHDMEQLRLARSHGSPPCRLCSRQRQRGKSEVVNNENEFRINMDVKHFKPGEIRVKVKDNRLIVSALHEERPDEHGFIKREFSRQYALPEDVDSDAITSVLTKEGILKLKAPKIKGTEDPKERKIPITYDK